VLSGPHSVGKVWTIASFGTILNGDGEGVGAAVPSTPRGYQHPPPDTLVPSGLGGRRTVFYVLIRSYVP
jgi:hypothetical protein